MVIYAETDIPASKSLQANILCGMGRYLANRILKFTRPEKRKHVTLIAAFRCDIDGDPGVIVCADSQESYGSNYRVTVDKIKPRDAVNYDLVIGGAGQIGPLIDGLANTVERYIQGWPAGLPEEKARGLIEHKINRYSKGQIQNYPTDADKVLDFIVCLRDRTSKAIYLWRAAGTVVEPIEYYDLIGWDEPLYRYEAERLYEKGRATKISAITLGVHLLSTGKATAISIDEPFQVIGISKEQVWVELPSFVDSLAHKVGRVNSTLSKLIISASKLSLSDHAFDSALKRFEEEISGLRREAQQHTLQIQSSHHGHMSSPLSVEPVFVPESPLQNPKPKEGKKTSKRKNP
jgi:hypothetical protein